MEGLKKIFDFLTMLLGAIILIPILIGLGIAFPPLGIGIVILCIWLYLKDQADKRKLHEQQILQEKRQREQQDLQDRYIKTLNEAKAGNPSAQYQYGLMALRGEGCISHTENALSWITSSANLGYCEAQEMMGMIYEKGKHDVEKDYKKALAYYLKAEASGSKLAREKVVAIQKQIEIERREIQERKAFDGSDEEWIAYNNILSLCESEPELILLKALIQRANLKPVKDKLIGSVSVIPQVNILQYRVDFLINDNLVVEVDGKQYHNNSTSFESDRIRDQDLLLAGYRTIRFPASQIYRGAVNAADIVIKVSR